MFRLFGDLGATLMVTSQHRSLSEETDYVDLYDYDDETEWTRPTLHTTLNAPNNHVDSLVAPLIICMNVMSLLQKL